MANYITRAEGIYVTLNEINPALLARAHNRLMDRPKSTTGNADVVRRRIFYVDVDPVRPAQISATDAEHTLALARVRQIGAYLQELGAPAPLLADSGNGGHALWRIDLPADDGGLVQDALRALALRFSDALAKVDETVGNPARIGKLYGTWARKGDSMADRPHRLARMLAAPERLAEMPVAILQQLKGTLPATKPARRHAGTGHTPAERSFDLKAWVERYLPEAGESSDWDTYTGKGRKWAIACPWNPEHTGRCALGGRVGQRGHHRRLPTRKLPGARLARSAGAEGAGLPGTAQRPCHDPQTACGALFCGADGPPPLRAQSRPSACRLQRPSWRPGRLQPPILSLNRPRPLRSSLWRPQGLRLTSRQRRGRRRWRSSPGWRRCGRPRANLTGPELRPRLSHWWPHVSSSARPTWGGSPASCGAWAARRSSRATGRRRCAKPRLLTAGPTPRLRLKSCRTKPTLDTCTTCVCARLRAVGRWSAP